MKPRARKGKKADEEAIARGAEKISLLGIVINHPGASSSAAKVTRPFLLHLLNVEMSPLKFQNTDILRLFAGLGDPLPGRKGTSYCRVVIFARPGMGHSFPVGNCTCQIAACRDRNAS